MRQYEARPGHCPALTRFPKKLWQVPFLPALNPEHRLRPTGLPRLWRCTAHLSQNLQGLLQIPPILREPSRRILHRYVEPISFFSLLTGMLRGCFLQNYRFWNHPAVCFQWGYPQANGKFIILVAELLKDIISDFPQCGELISTRCPSMIRSASESRHFTTDIPLDVHHPATSCSPILPICREGRVRIHANGLSAQAASS